MSWQIDPRSDDWEADWEGTVRWQMRYFRALPLRDKIRALEEMAELVRIVQKGRAQESSGGP